MNPSDTSNIHVLNLAYVFFERTGDLNTARDTLERWLVLSGPDTKSSDTAAAYGNLGNIYKTRGDLDRAESMHEKSLAIDEAGVAAGEEDGTGLGPGAELLIRRVSPFDPLH